MPRWASLRERFEASYVPEPNSGCWLWLGALAGIKVKRPTIWTGKTEVGARVSWQLHIGPIPEGMLVLHKRRCNVGLCVNYEHLYLGSYRDNAQDMVALGNARGSKGRIGDANPLSKLTDREVWEIRQLRGHMSQRELAQAYGVTKAYVGNIHAGYARQLGEALCARIKG